MQLQLLQPIVLCKRRRNRHHCAAAMARAMTQEPAVVEDAVVVEPDAAYKGQCLVGVDVADAICRDGMVDGVSACRRGRRCDGARACRRGRRCGGRWADRRGGSRLTPPVLLARVTLWWRRPLWWSLTDLSTIRLSILSLFDW